jgi:hypothetical protein
MSFESTGADLHGIVNQHQEVHDGGYRLASELCAYRNRMPKSTASEWDLVLLSWVRGSSARLWGVALEALARAGGPEVTNELSTLMRQSGTDSQWREYVTNTLIRRGFSNSWFVAEVLEAAGRTTPMGLQNLAALMVIVPDLISSAAACIIAALSAWKHEYVEGLIAPFVSTAADTDPDMLVRLVQEAKAQDQKAGEQLAEILALYLGRPFVQSRFPQNVASGIAARLGVGA